MKGKHAAEEEVGAPGAEGKDVQQSSGCVTIPRSRPKRSYDAQTIRTAVRTYFEIKSFRKAAKCCDVPKSTLHDDCLALAKGSKMAVGAVEKRETMVVFG